MYTQHWLWSVSVKLFDFSFGKCNKLILCPLYICVDANSMFLWQVPVIISLIIMVGYILGGAALFSQWEDNFTFVDGAYFCFITLTTIGFGDMVR